MLWVKLRRWAHRNLSASELGHVDNRAPEQVPGYILLPGDPNRISTMCASVVANRITGEWNETVQGEQNACLVGAEALRILNTWDEKKKNYTIFRDFAII